MEFLDRGFCDIFCPTFDHDVDSFVVDRSRPCFNDLPVDEVEAPQVVKALQPELMVM